MSYSVTRDDFNLTDAVRRIAQHQIDKAIDSLTGDAPGAAIHDARKRIKKLRGLIRLVRPEFDDYKAENVDLRDTARLLSSLRDRAAMIETYDRIASQATGMNRPATAPLRRRLTIESRAALDAPQAGERIADAVTRLRQTRERSEAWRVGGNGFEAAEAGMAKTLKRAQKAMGEALKSFDPHAMHEWRKRVKYHWYHGRLLKRSFPPLTKPHVDLADRLSDVLGDHHDLHVFEPQLAKAPISHAARASLEEAIAEQRAALEAEAARLGPGFLAGDAEALSERWRVWAETEFSADRPE